MSDTPPRAALIVIDIPGQPALRVENITPEHARIVAALTLLPPVAFRAVVARVIGWPVPPGAFGIDARFALQTLYAAIHEAFLE